MTKWKYTPAIMAVALFIWMGVSACSLQSLVSLRCPPEVKQAISPTPSDTLADAEGVSIAWKAYVDKNTAALQAAVNQSEESYAVLHSIASVGLEIGGTVSQGVPYGGMIFGLLAGATGVMLPQPKFMKKVK